MKSRKISSPRKSTVFPTVPKFQTYYSSISQMDEDAKTFYGHWLENWQQGIPIDVEGNISYLFVYAYEVLSWQLKNRFKAMLKELINLQMAYSKEDKFSNFVLEWLSDAYVSAGNIEAAVEALNKSTYPDWDRIVSLQLYLQQDVTETVASFCSKNEYFHTDFGRANTEKVKQFFIKIFHERTLSGQLDPESFFRGGYIYSLYGGVPIQGLSRNHLEIPFYKFHLGSLSEQRIREIWIEAENQLRESRGIPRIGEGWISETQLKNFVEELLNPLGYRVEFHARPSWLEGLELDIYVPALNLAIEYMGEQHYRPVELFGAEEGFERTLERDKRKAHLCEKRRILLIYYRFDEPLEISWVQKRLAEHPDLTVEMTPELEADK